MKRSLVLKIALFATGLSGIVAEYTLSTLATYFLGDSTFQWTMTVSLMLFSMGLGSSLSKIIDKKLIEAFIYTELTLSLLASFATIICYYISAFTNAPEIYIYGFSICIGALIGFEIPIVVRLNESYEALRLNIANVMEKDYYGSLLGGVFFAFIGVPLLGLTYTPFVFGSVNFLVAVGVFFRFKDLLQTPRSVNVIGTMFCLLAIIISLGIAYSKPIIRYGEQTNYKDTIVFEHQSKYQKIVMTSWKSDFWLFINGNQQLSSFDEHLYHEPLVHPAMSLHPAPKRVLVLGGGDGCAVREILKYNVDKIDLIDLDPAMTDLGKTHPRLVELNQNSLNSTRVHVKNQDGFTYLEKNDEFYDVIIIDLPDPKSIELSRLYSAEFYFLVNKRLRPNGLMVTQAGSPSFATNAFYCIEQTIRHAGFETLPLHNQIMTLGEWGWIVGSKLKTSQSLKEQLHSIDYKNVNTRFLNKEANSLLSSFGKQPERTLDSLTINTLTEPVLHRLYLQGNWELY